MKNLEIYVAPGGPKSCNHGCIGYGSCVKACQFDAIHIVDGIALVDKEACKACGKCVSECPKNLIELVPYEQERLVQCNSMDKGKDVMKICKVGCIGCRMCEKVCEADAITITNNVAHIDPRRKGLSFEDSRHMDIEEYKRRQYDQLADAVRENLNINEIYRMIGI